MVDLRLKMNVQPATGGGTDIPLRQTRMVLPWKSSLLSSITITFASSPPASPVLLKRHRPPPHGDDSLSLYDPDWAKIMYSLHRRTQNS